LGILNEFERRLEGVIEGIFTKAFRTGLQPVELATRILKEMEAHKTVGVRQVWVPNRYLFTMSQEDRDRFAQTEGALTRELEQVVREGAAERGWGLVGPPEVEFEIDQSLRQGEYDCEAVLVEGPPGVPDAGDSGSAELVIIEGDKPTRAYPLGKDRVIIGRLGESDVVLSDPGASRRHAEVRRQNGEWIISDLGSTNGTIVNQATIGERRLEAGDRITIGRTVLEFRRR
jgi:Protein of unknown function (DUF3662)/Inner membrane component of T3SS, cytoplasmic domain